MGALAALAPQYPWRFKTCGSREEKRPHNLVSSFLDNTTTWIGWLGLAGIIGAALILDEATLFPGTAALFPVLGTVMVLRMGSKGLDTGVARVLRTMPLQEIGRVSYSWYLWHWPVLVFASAIYGHLQLPARIGLIVLSFAIAEVSYRFIEMPVRYNTWLVRRSYRSLVMAASIAVVGVVVGFAWRQLSIEWAQLPTQIQFTRARRDIPAVYASGCHADFYTVNIDISKCVTGPADASYTIVLFGDSHAAQWYPAFKEITDKKGWRLISLTYSASI